MVTKVHLPIVCLRGSFNASSASATPQDIIPQYTITCEDKTFVQGEEYELLVSRVTAPTRQTQIEIEVTGGLVSPAYLVDEGEPYVFEDANRKILVTPTAATCTVVLKVDISGKVYSVGKYTMKASE